MVCRALARFSDFKTFRFSDFYLETFCHLFFILGRKWEIFSLIKAACSGGTDELTRKEFMNHEPPFPISILFYTVGREREKERESERERI
jgi:hypothetical protein